MDHSQILRTLPKEVRALVEREKYREAQDLLEKMTLENVPGVGQARLRSLLCAPGHDTNYGFNPAHAASYTPYAAWTDFLLWAVYVREVMERPDRFLAQQKENVSLQSKEVLEEMRSTPNAFPIVASRWDQASIKAFRKWAATFYFDDIQGPFSQ